MTVPRCLYCGGWVTDLSAYCNHVIKKHKDQIKKTTLCVLHGCDPHSVTRITIEGDDEKRIKVCCVVHSRRDKTVELDDA